MTGRMENKLKTENKILNKLEHCNKHLKNYYYYMDAEGKSHKTKDLYICYIDCFLRAVNKEVEDIESIDINKYITSLITSEKPQNYLVTVWYALKSFFNYLLNSDIISEDIMKGCPRPKRKSSNEVDRVYLNPDELKQLIENVKHGVGTDKAKAYQEGFVERDMAIMMTFINLGIRLTALIEINVEDVDLENSILKVTDKRNKTTNFPMNDTLRLYIEDWLIKRKEIADDTTSNALFLSSRKERMSANTVRSLVKKYTTGIKDKPISPHKLRASFATNLYEATGDIQLVQEAMNHTDVSTTQLYVQSSDRNRKRASSAIESIMNF